MNFYPFIFCPDGFPNTVTKYLSANPRNIQVTIWRACHNFLDPSITPVTVNGDQVSIMWFTLSVRFCSLTRFAISFETMPGTWMCFPSVLETGQNFIYTLILLCYDLFLTVEHFPHIFLILVDYAFIGIRYRICVQLANKRPWSSTISHLPAPFLWKVQKVAHISTVVTTFYSRLAKSPVRPWNSAVVFSKDFQFHDLVLLKLNKTVDTVLCYQNFADLFLSKKVFLINHLGQSLFSYQDGLKHSDHLSCSKNLHTEARKWNYLRTRPKLNFSCL